MRQYVKKILSVIGALTGILILLISVPRLVAEMILLPNASVVQKITSGQDISDDDLRKVYISVVDAGGWHLTGDLLLQRSEMEMIYAKRSQTKTERNNWLEKSERSVEQSLQSSPGNPYAWMRLAHLRYTLSGIDAGVKDLLMMSMLTGPYEWTLALNHVEYALLMWDQLSDTEQKRVQDKILWVDSFRRHDLVNLAKRDKGSMRIIVSSIAREPLRLKRFLQLLFKK